MSAINVREDQDSETSLKCSDIETKRFDANYMKLMLNITCEYPDAGQDKSGERL